VEERAGTVGTNKKNVVRGNGSLNVPNIVGRLRNRLHRIDRFRRHGVIGFRYYALHRLKPDKNPADEWEITKPGN